MEKLVICQSCGTNIEDDKCKGTNAEGSLSIVFCSFCFLNGEFCNKLTLDEQVDRELEYAPEYKNAKTQEEKDSIKQRAIDYLSKLTRWNCTCTEACAGGYNPQCTCTSDECHCTEKTHE